MFCAQEAPERAVKDNAQNTHNSDDTVSVNHVKLAFIRQWYYLKTFF